MNGLDKEVTVIIFGAKNYKSGVRKNAI